MIHFLLTNYHDCEIINLDALTYAGNLDNLKDVSEHPRYSFVHGDIASPDTVNEICEKNIIDVIVNYAAETHVDRSLFDPTAFLRTAIYGTYTLLEAVKRYGIPKMIQISTDEVYGYAIEGKFSESSPFAPSSPYSAAKAGADHLCHSYFQSFRTPVIVTHSCNCIGPFQYPEKFIPLFITNLLEGKKVPVYGDGKQVREWVDTYDHCRAISLIIERGRTGESYNIGTGNELRNIDVAKMIFEYLDKDESFIEYVKDRPGHDVRYAVDATKLRSELKWEPKYSFGESLERTIAWYSENEWWWKKIKSGEFRRYYEKQYVERVRG